MAKRKPVEDKQGDDGALVEQDDTLSVSERRFVENVVYHQMKGAPAAREAGLSGHTAVKLMARPRVVQAIAEEREQIRRRLDVTRDDIVGGLREAVDIARLQGDPKVMVSGWMGIAEVTGQRKPEKSSDLSEKERQVLDKLANMADGHLEAILARESRSSIIEHEEAGNDSDG